MTDDTTREFLCIASMLPDAKTVAAEARKRLKVYPLVAEQIRSGTWIVRPEGQLGTCGNYPYAWDAIFVRAFTEQGALKRAKARLNGKAR